MADILMEDWGQWGSGLILGPQPYAARRYTRVWSYLLVQWFGQSCYVLRLLQFSVLSDGYLIDK